MEILLRKSLIPMVISIAMFDYQRVPGDRPCVSSNGVFVDGVSPNISPSKIRLCDSETSYPLEIFEIANLKMAQSK